MRDDREPVSAGYEPGESARQTERRAFEGTRVGLAAAMFGGIVLVGGVLAILLIALFPVTWFMGRARLRTVLASMRP